MSHMLFSVTPFLIVAVLFSPSASAEKPPQNKKGVFVEEASPEPVVVLRRSKPVKRKIASAEKDSKSRKGNFEKSASIRSGEDLEKLYKEELKYLESQKQVALDKDGRAPSSKKPDHVLAFNEVERKYASQYVKMDISKKVTQALLERTKNYEGEMALAPQGLFKLEIKEPSRSLLIMDGKNIWVVDYPVDDMQNKVQILHSKTHKNLKNQAFLGFLMGQGQMLKKFKIDNFKKNENKITYKLIPKEKDYDVESVEIVMDTQDKLIKTVGYWDALGNKTQLEFKNQVFSSKVPAKLFQFLPPKNSSVTNL